MATQEGTSGVPQVTTHHSAPVLPNYPELIMGALEALNDKNGSNKSSISRQIEVTINNVPAAHTTLLTHHLNRMKQTGQIIMVKNNYMVPNPDAPPKRGRGRPPKPKDPEAELLQAQPPRSPRPRGRPPKVRDPDAPSPPPSEPKPEASVSGRKRGRPPKKAKTEAEAEPSSVPVSVEPGVKRGRGRPPKAKPDAVEAVAS